MDNATTPVDRTNLSLNGSMRRPAPTTGVGVGMHGRPQSLMDTSPSPGSGGGGTSHVISVVVNRDERGYGMKVSGDNPVYVQSVKEGGAAEKAGLHAGDKIIKVNGVDVRQSTHTDVVALIKSSSQVVLTVQQRSQGVYLRPMGSPSLHTRPATTHSSRITGPQPVDHEKMRQFQLERVHTIRLMLEKEQRYVETLRSDLAHSGGNEKKQTDLNHAERNVAKLQEQLEAVLCGQNEPSLNPKFPSGRVGSPVNTLPFTNRPRPKLPHSNTFPVPASDNEPPPPPLPKRNQVLTVPKLGSREIRPINGKTTCTTPKKPQKILPQMCKSHSNPESDMPTEESPPPVPPRVPLSGGNDPDAVNSINKQMSYPLVATCTTLVNNYSSHNTNHTHHRTKSSPDPLTLMSPSEASKKLIASESMSDLTKPETWETPPGTPPPPYPSPLANKKHPGSNRNSANTEDGDSFHEEGESEISPDSAGIHQGPGPAGLLTSSPIMAASTHTVQRPIMSFEDDEMSDQEVSQLEDHGPFKSLARLWDHTPHLAVFMNYVLSNCDPSSLLFYLLTDLYKEGVAKEMRKWAYEIHSSFLVPGAPLRLNNVDENIAREVDEVLLKEFDKEEILRKIFWKARIKAKEELNDQLADFQQKRKAGLGTLFGPTDSELETISHDRSKQTAHYEAWLLDKLTSYLEEFDKDAPDQRRCLTASALATIMTKMFGVPVTHVKLDRCPTFISKEKSYKKLFGKYSRRLNFGGHHYNAQQYYTVISCNHCHQIIYGIGPQGYQCSVCLINLHRQCVKLYEDICPGPINKKDNTAKGIGLFKNIISSNDSKRKPSSHFVILEREKRLAEERDGIQESEAVCGTVAEKPGQPVSRASSDRRPDAVTEETPRTSENPDSPDAEVTDISHDSAHSIQRARSSQPGINRSESYKEQSQKRRQIRERRKISDPNLSKTNDVDSDHQGLSFHSGSSSNSSLSSSRSSESPPSASLDTVYHSQSIPAWDSDVDVDADPPDWQSNVPEDVLSRLHPQEKKRQEVINELFHTERSHVRNLRVLEKVFCRPLLSSKCLPADQVALLFPNLDEMLDIHCGFRNAMRSKQREQPVIGDVGELLLNMFDGPAGENFQRAAATFCARQQIALESLKERRRRDTRLNSFLIDCESNKLCKRLQLKDIIPTGMQRLVKYPLLFESLVRCTERVLEAVQNESATQLSSSPTSATGSTTAMPLGPTQAELGRLRRAVDRSKEILNYVNQAVKEAEDCARLQDMQRKLDKTGFERVDHPIVTEFRNVDLTKHKLIYEGPLGWRIGKQRLNLHVVLLEELILLLHKQDDRYILKFYSSTGVERSPNLSPIVKVSTVLVRPNAADSDSLFLVNTAQNGAQIYDLVASSPAERKLWFKHISEAAEAYKNREGKTRRSELTTPESDEAETGPGDLTGGDNERAESTGGDTTSVDTQSVGDADSSVPSGQNSQRSSGVLDDDVDKQGDTDSAAENDGSGNRREASSKQSSTEERALIQPSEVRVNTLPVHTAEPVLTPIEQVRRKDEAIRQALADKEALVADLLEVPHEHYHMLADMAGEISGEKEPVDLVLAAVNQATQLLSVVNDSLNINEEDPVLASGGHHPPCASSTLPAKTINMQPCVPTYKLQDIANSLNRQLTSLLSVVKEQKDEKERMRKELQKMREQIHVMHQMHQTNECPVHDSIEEESTPAGDFEDTEESPTPN